MRLDSYRKWLQWLVLAVACVVPARAQQINLATQVRGLLAPANGGTGLNTSTLTGCPVLTGGVWAIVACNASTGFILSTPTTSQAITQPAGTSLTVNNTNLNGNTTITTYSTTLSTNSSSFNLNSTGVAVPVINQTDSSTYGAHNSMCTPAYPSGTACWTFGVDGTQDATANQFTFRYGTSPSSTAGVMPLSLTSTGIALPLSLSMPCLGEVP